MTKKTRQRRFCIESLRPYQFHQKFPITYPMIVDLTNDYWSYNDYQTIAKLIAVNNSARLTQPYITNLQHTQV